MQVRGAREGSLLTREGSLWFRVYSPSTESKHLYPPPFLPPPPLPRVASRGGAGAICNPTVDDDGNKDAIARAGGVEALLSLLRSPGPGQPGGGICEAAAKAIWNMAHSPEVKLIV